MAYRVYYYKHENSKSTTDLKIYKTLTAATKHAKKVVFEHGTGFCSIKSTENGETIAIIRN